MSDIQREAYEKFALKELGIVAKGNAPGWKIWQAACAWQKEQGGSEEAGVWIDPDDLKKTLIAMPGERAEVSAHYEGRFTAPLFTRPCDSVPLSVVSDLRFAVDDLERGFTICEACSHQTDFADSPLDCLEWVRGAWQYLDKQYSTTSQHAASVPEMDEEVRWILGRPNFSCIGIAQKLRDQGREIKHKAEHEQAEVIHWMLGLYAKHGSGWRKEAGAILAERPNPPAEGAE